MTPPLAYAEEIRGLQSRERESLVSIAELASEQRHLADQLEGVLDGLKELSVELKELRLAFDKQVVADQSAHRTLEVGLEALGKSYANDKGFLLGLAKKAALLAVGGGAIGTAAPWLKTVLENLL